MIDVLAPLALLGMAGLVVLAVMTARRQREARQRLFRNLASSAGWRFLETDDGSAEALARDFRDFGVFRSPSLGRKVPGNVVLGKVPAGRLVLFLHATRRHEGDARSWTVCIVEAACTLCSGPLRVHPREVRTARELGGDPVVVFDEDRAFEERFQVTTPDPGAARDCLDPRVRGFLRSRAPSLPFPVGLQIRDRRVAAYWAGRNDGARTPAELRALVGFTADLAETLATG